MLFFVAQSCPTSCDPMDCSLPGSSVRGDSLGKNTGVSCHALLQGIFLTQGSNLCLLIAGRFFTSGPPGKPIQINNCIFVLQHVRGGIIILETNIILIYLRHILFLKLSLNFMRSRVIAILNIKQRPNPVCPLC